MLSEITAEQLYSKEHSQFPFEKQVPFHQLAAWLHLELMKNAAEIGHVRFDYGKVHN